MNKRFPIASGLFAGLIASSPSLRTRFLGSIMLGSVVAVTATLANGAYRVGWYFLRIDAALAIGAAMSVPAFARAPRGFSTMT
jgi:hypothetical protein